MELEKNNRWQTVSSKQVYKNPWISVREDVIIHPNGKEGIYGVVDIPPGIFTVALNAENHVLLVRQLHYPTGLTSWELPGGGLKPGLSHEEQALLELQEEALMEAETFKKLGTTQTQPGITTQLDHFFLATNVSAHKTPELENAQSEEGISEARFFSHEEIRQMIRSGEINHGQSITGYSLYLLSQSQ